MNEGGWLGVSRGLCLRRVCGAQVHDPYRWLEDDSAAAEWVAAQEVRTQEYFRSIAATRDLLKERLEAAYDGEKAGCTFPVGRGSERRYYFYRREGLRSHACLMSSRQVDGDAHVFFDPSALSCDGSKALGACAFSPSGKFWAYGVSSSGSGLLATYPVCPPSHLPSPRSLAPLPPHLSSPARPLARLLALEFKPFLVCWSVQNGKLFTSARFLQRRTCKIGLNGSSLAPSLGFPTTLGLSKLHTCLRAIRAGNG